jgi:hypothetical protein
MYFFFVNQRCSQGSLYAIMSVSSRVKYNNARADNKDNANRTSLFTSYNKQRATETGSAFCFEIP